MKIGMIGLGKMGSNLARRLMRGGHECVVFDYHPEIVTQLAQEGATPSSSTDTLIQRLPRPRVVWVMVPAGPPTESVITAALYARFRSRKDHTFSEKVLSAMRFEFGGHVEEIKTGGSTNERRKIS
jgi:6-phosphogluconate dehydrogenase (decarboxylating)